MNDEQVLEFARQMVLSTAPRIGIDNAWLVLAAAARLAERGTVDTPEGAPFYVATQERLQLLLKLADGMADMCVSSAET